MKMIGAINNGTPDGKNMWKKPLTPFLVMAKIVMVKKAIIDKAKVTMMWLVTVKL